MNFDDDFDSQEIFDGAIELQRHERGESFGLESMTYFRLARCCNDAGAMGVEPALICKLSKGERGVKVVLFGPRHAFTILVRRLRSCTTFSIFSQPLDGLRCEIPVFEGEDCDRSWSRGLRAMLEFENIAYYDSFWAEDAQQQGDGDGVEA